eukprot:gnl/TRDRNA2_/TRDRNA2_82934_c0_seq1.p1 gnl/TRDRNA2_/TRDRNA2_82934_c0~~gnl/TRDRNA2_/TRDRNA2_82934_c0_seq1.p1  ORF type:complete len:595 (-),score=147.94 gnl/TRDRNA2_/TRDRNA2_82934_c0_seq1:37-1821(-)
MEEALQATANVDSLSFYGLSHWVEKVNELLDRVDHASVAKNPKQEDVELAERKDELLEAQSVLRRAMGARLEKPNLTKREKPLAEAFLKQQLAKLEKGASAKGGESRVTTAIERLKQILSEVTTGPPAPESREVRETELEIKQLDADWKELEPIHKKWEAGRHAFKTNSDLQDFLRRYKACEKGRSQGDEKLHKALCSVRDEAAAAKLAQQDAKRAAEIKSGWLGVAASAKSKAAPKAKAGGAVLRKPLPTAKRPGMNAWGSQDMTFAQRMRAEMEAKVRAEVAAEAEARVHEDEEKEDGAEDEEEEEEAAPPVVRPKAPPVMAKGPPPLQPTVAPPRAAAAPAAVADDEDDEEPAADAPTASAKAQKSGKKGKKKKTGGSNVASKEEDEEDWVQPQGEKGTAKRKSQVPAWAAQVEASIRDSLLHDLLRPSSWSMMDAELATGHLEVLTHILAWTSPLGFSLPLDWKEFFGLEIDGGPKPTSKRGTPPWLLRLQANVPWLLAHYVTLIFTAALLHDLSHFGLLLWVGLLQAALLLAPPGAIPAPTHVLALQGAHMLLWMCFVRSLWSMHFFIKCFGVLAVAAHAYVINPCDES